MEITHGSHFSFTSANAKHRNSGLSIKPLHVGAENTPENYSLSLFRQNGFYSPRHRHNFDQFRYSIKGTFNLGPGLDIKQGQLAYHPEGVEYGPQNDGDQEQDLLVLQFGGASRMGYLSLRQIRAANAELVKSGRFEGGRYFVGGDKEGEGKGVDGYEAAWSFAMGGTELVYPRGRYNAPIIMDPENFAYREKEGVGGGEKGVARKLLGVFSEREVRVEMLRVSEGAEVVVGGDDAIHLLFVVKGEGMVGSGGENLFEESSVRLSPGMKVTVVGRQEVEMLHFVMPMFT